MTIDEMNRYSKLLSLMSAVTPRTNMLREEADSFGDKKLANAILKLAKAADVVSDYARKKVNEASACYER